MSVDLFLNKTYIFIYTMSVNLFLNKIYIYIYTYIYECQIKINISTEKECRRHIKRYLHCSDRIHNGTDKTIV